MITQKSLRCSALLAGLLFVSGLCAQTAASKLSLPTTNPAGSVKQRVGITDIEVTYNRPGVKGRKIFGGLVPYGQVWRTGSDSATKITFSTAVKVNGAEVPAGAYELFTIPGAEEWTVIIHQNKSQWGSYSYDAANDVARAAAKPVALSEAVESFTISLGDLTASGATLNLAWDRVRVPVRIETDVVGLVVPQIDAALQAEGKKPYFLAAMFYYENGLDLEKAAAWMNAAIAERPGHIGMLHRLALILAKKGDKPGALAAAQQSLEGAQKTGPELREEYTRLNTALIEKLKQ
jgi:Protein of unknown function (DUF2911)